MEGRRAKVLAAELVAHVGGAPSAPQRLLIARAVRLVLVIEMLEKRIVEGGEIGDLAGRQLLAWVNTLRLALVALGVERPQQAPKRLADILDMKGAA
jgi:hypothetical protein